MTWVRVVGAPSSGVATSVGDRFPTDGPFALPDDEARALVRRHDVEIADAPAPEGGAPIDAPNDPPAVAVQHAAPPKRRTR